MDGNALITLHHWSKQTFPPIELYEFEGHEGLYLQFADHSIFCWAYLIHLQKTTSEKYPVYTYSFGKEATEVAHSFTHFLERWLDEKNIIYTLDDGESISVKQKTRCYTDGAPAKDK